MSSGIAPETLRSAAAREISLSRTVSEARANHDLLATNLASELAPPGPASGVSRTRIGRFTILWALGEGAMGIVYAAYDGQLDRKVAVKMLLGETLRKDPKARGRMLREAQAMARVSHPNIVTVHEVGMYDGEVYIAMEFLRGRSVVDWLGAAPRPWREIVSAFLQAGRGLAAAHAAGIVHRDFKPANVLVGDDGVVKVLDFGLSRTVPTPGLEDSSSPNLHRTRPGTVLGTPAYMSPEQHLCEPSTHLSDQFSFCVSLWEALYGQPPFDRSSVKVLKSAVTQGRLREPPPNADVPGALLPLLRRGLALDPELRFPAMPELLAELERALAPRRPPWYALVGLGGLLASAGLATGLLAEREDPCGAADRELVGVWDAPTAAATRTGILATRVPFAEDTWNRVERHLDAYARSLIDMRVDACRAHEEGRASTNMFDLRTACLDQRHASLVTLVGILQHADAEVLRNAGAAAAALPPLATCSHTQALADAVALPGDPAQAMRVGHIRAVLAEAHAHELTGQFTQGLALVDSLDPGGLDHPPVLAELRLRRASLLSEAGRHQEADALLGEALRGALASDHDQAAAEIATRREFIRVARLQRAHEVLTEAVIVEGLIARMDTYDEGRRLRGDHLNNLGIAHAVLGQSQLAEDRFAASLAARSEVFGAEHPQVVYALGNLGLVLLDSDDVVEATRRLHAAFIAAATTLGPRHPHVAQLALNLGKGYLALGRYREAEASLTRALALQTEALGPESADLHSVLGELGDLAIARRRCDEAAANYERALRVLGQTDAPTEPSALHALFGRGRVAACQGDLAAARGHVERAWNLAERTLGADKVPLEIVDSLGDMYLQSGDSETALSHYRRAEALRRARLPPNSPRMGESYRRIAEVHRRRNDLDAAAAALEQAPALLPADLPATSLLAAQLEQSLGALALERARPDEAAAHYEQAATIYAELSDDDSLDLALARFGWARALAGQSGPHTHEARALVETALATVEALGPAFAPEAREIRSWRATLPDLP